MATVIDDTIRGCLHRIARRDVSAVGVLADYLEETSHALAGRVRRLWDWYVVREKYWTDRDPVATSRRRLTAWEGSCITRHKVWWQIRQLFRRKWKWQSRLAFKSTYSPPARAALTLARTPTEKGEPR